MSSRYQRETKVYIGDLGPDTRKEDLEDAFSTFGRIESVWLAQNPPGFGFVVFEDDRDAKDSVKELDGTDICGARVRVELARERRRGGGRGGGFGGRGGGFGRRGGRGGGDVSCYSCGGRGHFARDCNRSGGGGGGGDRYRRYDRSRSRSRD